MAEEPVKLNSQELPQGKTAENKRSVNAPGKPFEPGNQYGRKNYGTPHFGPLFKAALKRFVITKDGEQITAEEAIVRQAIAKAANGDVKFAQLVMDRMEGKPKQPIELGPEGAGTKVITPEEQKRIEDMFAFKQEPIDLSKKQSKVEVHPIATAPLPKPAGGLKQIIPPGKVIVAKPTQPPVVQPKEQSIILKRNVGTKPNNGR